MGNDLSRLRTVREVADYEARAVHLRAARDVVKTATDFVALVHKEIHP